MYMQVHMHTHMCTHAHVCMHEPHHVRICTCIRTHALHGYTLLRYTFFARSTRIHAFKVQIFHTHTRIYKCGHIMVWGKQRGSSSVHNLNLMLQWQGMRACMGFGLFG
jgi:hypothetical protein